MVPKVWGQLSGLSELSEWSDAATPGLSSQTRGNKISTCLVFFFPSFTIGRRA